MHDLGRRKAVEARTAGGRIGAYVFGVEQFAQFQIRKLLSHTDGIEGVTSGAEDRANLSIALLETFQGILGVVKDHAAIGMINAVIDVIT